MVDTLIELSNAAVYQKDLLVLSDVNININKGEFIYLVGVTGSGKTSLLKILYADLKLKEGEGTIAGYELHNLKAKQIPMLRRRLGIVFQDFQLLFDRSVRNNLIFVMKATGWKDKKKMEERMMDVLTKVGLETKAHKMPHQLSGGEQQRLSIARALINDPEIILADEPTGNLDPETSRGIMKLLKSLSEAGRAVLMATHDYALFDEFPGRLVKFEDGKVLATVK